MEEILIICLIGAIAGWIAGAIVRYDSGSFLLDIVIGIIGGYVGYRLFGASLDLTHNYWIDRVITASAGAVIPTLVLKVIQSMMRRHRHAA